MTRRGAVAVPLALALVTGVAWWLTVERMRMMNDGPTAQLGGFGWFTFTWALMMTAMMLPAVVRILRRPAPARPGQTSRWRQVVPPIATVVVYLAVWTVAGTPIYLALRIGRSLFGGAFAWPRGGRWLCVAIIAVAAAYQLTETKGRWLARCHAPAINAEATIGDGVTAGWHAGLRCLASSWALMAALFALGAMSLVWMAVIAAWIAVERLAPMRWWRRRPLVASISAVLLGALAVALAASPGSVPGFTVPGRGPSHAMSRAPGSAAAEEARTHVRGPARAL